MDIIIVSETWFKTNQLCLYDLEGFTSILSCRERKRGGGLSVYVREPWMITKMEIQDEEWNLAHIELSNFKGVSKLSVYGVYRPPKKTRPNSYLRRIEEFLGGTSGKVILVGDMNVDLNKTHDHNVKMYIDTMTSLGLTVCNNNVTHESSNAILDHIFFVA